MAMRRGVTAFGTFVVLAGFVARSDEPAVDVSWGVKIPVRDGCTLNATLYRPAHRAAPGESPGAKWPVVVTITPYVSDTYHERGMYFARQGNAFAIVDVRGRGNSEGT